MSIPHLLRQTIRQCGHITIADAMATIIAHPDYGYYANSKSLGKDGDFITSPEISQVFGELIGIWCADLWQQMGKPTTINLVELGPGKGTMILDLLRIAKMIPDFNASIALHLVEISPKLTEIQQTILSGYQVTWHKNLSTLPNSAMIVIANEFFDCLPIHQYHKIKDDWLEKALFLDLREELMIGDLPIKRSLLADLNREYSQVAIGGIVELSPTACNIAGQIADIIATYGGAMLIIDYGYDYPPNQRPNYVSTLQAIFHHNFHPILADLGHADLTAHVDFHSLRVAAQLRNLPVSGTTTQAHFLNQLGIQKRIEQLLTTATAKQKLDLVTGAERLTSPYQMGELFKVMCFAHRDLNFIAGF